MPISSALSDSVLLTPGQIQPYVSYTSTHVGDWTGLLKEREGEGEEE